MKGLGKAAKRHPIPNACCVHYANNGGAACRACKKGIAEKELRFGCDAHDGDWHSYHWHHWGCVTDELLRKVGGKERLWKVQRLDPKDKQMIEQRFERLK
ncbi:hypothetical protein CHLNCDRAFT_134238 [Chlorella variabilis]|uniref:PARP-type domain-containing protein n=1 Tax=Chlorella variabilis TaxID=554065 RepID=E1ZFK4_CHLVA|nr:hypothetical protein CHLNCDRAFT_134238 [Chlorella variabilis]EFN55148.1 hypothetical protein CHLNCDRAFT_134238 [Chlorella variabilis]|eukprot:XP_005847250.1 hypothetical protein CHLNCDRAFT_134238 [Chlorella variabilis]